MKENVQNNIIAEEKTSRAIESVSRAAKDNYGETLLSASYNNKQRYTASKLAKQFGSAPIKKLK